MAFTNICESKEEIVVPAMGLEVFLMSCPCNIPVHFAKHHWFVIRDNEKLSRWESGYTRGRGIENWGHLRKNDKQYKATQGISIFPLFNTTWNSQTVKTWQGAEAETLRKVIENSPNNYPYLEYYFLLGPNSNTYIQWALIQAGIDYKLPLSAVGKDYATGN